MRKLNEEVLVAEGPLSQISRADIEPLKRQAPLTPRRRIRICAHPDAADRLHEMIIVQTRGVYIRPHKHLKKSESAHVIEGTVDVVFFDEGGRVTEVVQLGEYGSGRQFFYRLEEPRYHTLLITSEFLVYHEVTNGPFVREDTVYAPWAPKESDIEACAQFQKNLARLIGQAA